MIESSSFQMPQSQPEIPNLPKHWPSCELESHSLHSRFPMLLPNPPEPGSDTCPDDFLNEEREKAETIKEEEVDIADIDIGEFEAGEARNVYIEYPAWLKRVEYGSKVLPQKLVPLVMHSPNSSRSCCCK